VNWSVGVATGACFDQPLTETLGVLQAAGVRGVEIGTPPGHFDVWKPDVLEAVRDRLRDLPIGAISIHAPFGHALDLAHWDAGHREAGLEGIALSARAIKRLGGSIVVAHPSDLPRAAADISARLDASAASLRQAADRCRVEGVRLAIESPLPHLVGGHPDEFGWLLQHVGDAAGVCLDTGHIALGRAWRRFMAVADGRLIHVHASDNHGQFDDHLPPGEGIIDWREVMGSLDDAGFMGWMMLELRCPPRDPVTYFRDAVARCEALHGVEPRLQ
jgi:sugar phosphate isomerase/epimerase